ncbi:substrate-binding periplasmic protein [Pseudoalteromonas fenneropenaei]|uniref:Substrate-binding periplasmic protein n=1 Tax=Pseudoalteromonas fenneropenaei TaxID=1737459 RepID=A0ABV7CN10_9GAMM
MKLVLILLFFFTLSLSASAIEKVESFKICFERWWPYSYVDDDRYPKGIEVETIQLAAQQAGFYIHFIELPYKRCIEEVKSGLQDFSLHVDPTDGLQMLNNSYTDWELSFAVKKGRFTSLPQLLKAAPRVILADEYPYPQAVYDKLDSMRATVVRRSFYEQSDEEARAFFSVLDNERVEAILVDKRWAAKMAKKFNLAVMILDEIFHLEPQFIGFRADRYPQAKKLEQALERLSTAQKIAISIKYQE